MKPTRIVLNTGSDRLHYVRLSTLAETLRREVNFVSAPIAAIEDNDYSEPTVPTNDAERAARATRKRQLSTMIDLRNVF